MSLEMLKVAAVSAKAEIEEILVAGNAPARLKMPLLIFGDVVEILTFHPKETDRAILLAKDGCECLAVCAGKATDADCAARIEVVLRKVSRATALCAPLLK